MPQPGPGVRSERFLLLRDALGDAPVLLSSHEQRVQDAAAVVHRDVAQQA